MTSVIGGHVQFASLLALSEYTAEMGATRIVPGSHQWPSDREPLPEEIAIAEMQPGSAAIYLGGFGPPLELDHRPEALTV